MIKVSLLVAVCILISSHALAQFGGFGANTAMPYAQPYNQFGMQSMQSQAPVYVPLNSKHRAMLRDLERKAEKARAAQDCFQRTLQSEKQELQAALQRIQQLEQQQRPQTNPYGMQPFQQRW